MEIESSSFFRSTADRFLMLPLPVLWKESSRCQWQWKLFFLQVVGMVTTVHWCILCFIAGCWWGADKICSLSPSTLCTVPWKGTLCGRWMSRLLKWAHQWTHMHTCPGRGHVFTLSSHCIPSCYLVLQVTLQIPAGILACLLTRVESQGPSKCAAKFASPAQWDTRCTALQRGYASPTGPGRGDSRSANVSKILNVFVMQMSPPKAQWFYIAGVWICFWTEWNQNILGLYVFTLLTMW